MDKGLSHEFFLFENILMNKKDIIEKQKCCEKIKCLCEVYENISKIKSIEINEKESRKNILN